MPSHKCKHPICPSLIPKRGYCELHQHLAPSNYDETDRLYDQQGRDQRAKKFYASIEWQSARAHFLMHHPMCGACGRKLATTVHHVKPVKEVIDADPRLLVAGENLFAVCSNVCHGRMERLHRRGKGNSAASRG